jgi:hypothetical protein
MNARWRDVVAVVAVVDDDPLLHLIHDSWKRVMALLA